MAALEARAPPSPVCRVLSFGLTPAAAPRQSPHDPAAEIGDDPSASRMVALPPKDRLPEPAEL